MARPQLSLFLCHEVTNSRGEGLLFLPLTNYLIQKKPTYAKQERALLIARFRLGGGAQRAQSAAHEYVGDEGHPAHGNQLQDLGLHTPPQNCLEG